jgi:dTDP-4-amino-4,6-dideoxygalactose transaminase
MGNRFWWQDFDDCGYNFRMTDIQGAVGVVQLRKLDALNQRRIENAARIFAGLRGVPGLTLPTISPDCKHVFHLYPIQIDAEKFGRTRDDFIYAMLNERGIKAGTHYTPLHLSSAFLKRGFRKGQFPVAEAVGERLATLPINPRQTPEALDYLIESVWSMARA